MNFCKPVDCSGLTSGKLESYGNMFGSGVCLTPVSS